MIRFVLAILLLLLCPSSGLSAERVVHISTGEWAPWTGEDLPHYGFFNHVVKEAFERQDYEVQFDFYPWTRAMNLVVHGEVDASSYWYETDKKQDVCDYSDVVSFEEIVFFHLKGKPVAPWKELIDLRDYRIGVMKGITYTGDLWALGRRGALKLFPSKTAAENFAKLIRDRIDIYPAAKLMGLEVLETQFTPEERGVITFDPTPLIESKGYLLFTKKRPSAKKLRHAFNEGLKELREDGTYDRLLRDLHTGKYAADRKPIRP